MRISEFSLANLVWKAVALVNRTVNLINVDGVALQTHAAGYIPGDTWRVEGAAMTTHATGHMASDNRAWLGTTCATPDTAGYPKVTVKAGTGTGEISLSSGLVQTVTTNPGAIRSIQRRTMTIANGATSGTSTLSPTLTDSAKAELRFLGWTLNDTTYTDPSRDFPRIELTNTTTVTANMGSTSNGITTLSYEVTERY